MMSARQRSFFSQPWKSITAGSGPGRTRDSAECIAASIDGARID